jgi:4-amino-4-deoxy-L-arabinose transferase-like glycosyltransferase
VTAARALLTRVPPLGWALLVAAALLLPRLGSFGFWEPWEARLAEASGPGIPPAVAALLAMGEKLGGGEAASRVLFALTGLLAAVAVYWVGNGLFGKRAGMLSAVVLVTMPLFSFQARQLISDMPLVLGLALSLGLVRYAWGTRRTRDLVIGLVGLVLATLSGGALVGVGVPAAATAASLLLARDPRRHLLYGLGGVAVLVVVVSLARTHTAGVYSLLLGGVPRLGAPTLTFEWAIRQIGFGLFPWSALAFFALGQPLASADEERLPPARMALLFFAAFAFALATARGLLVGEGRFAALAPIALALGAFLDDQFERPPERIVALLAGVGTIVLARDLFLEPQELFSLHTLEKVKWPPMLEGKHLLLASGILFALAVWFGVGMRRRAGIWGAMAVAVGFSALLIQGMVPALSQHLSPRRVLDAYRRAAPEGTPLARYRVVGEGASALRSAPGPTLSSPQDLVSFLAKPSRAFAVVAAEELAPVDEALKLARLPYAVLDASSSRMLLLTNRLGAGESDQNPLRKNVWMPEHEGDKPPWPTPRVVTSSVFVEAVQLIGADFPTTIHRPGGFQLTLYFRVLRKPPPGHNIFVHMATPGEALVNGDHEPVGGTFPTAHWVPGEYIRDVHTVDFPLAVTSSGTYTLFIGMWPGGNRPGIKITSGENDGNNRVPLGAVTVK